MKNIIQQKKNPIFNFIVIVLCIRAIITLPCEGIKKTKIKNLNVFIFPIFRIPMDGKSCMDVFLWALRRVASPLSFGVRCAPCYAPAPTALPSSQLTRERRRSRRL
jgi:hypothetical protein